MYLKITTDYKAGRTALMVSQRAVMGLFYGMTQYVSHVEIENSMYSHRTFLARRIVEMRRKVRAEIAAR